MVKARNAKPADPVTAYAKAVVAGKVPAGELHRLAAERHLRDMKEAKARGLKWNAKQAAEAVEFVSHLRHYKGEWAGKRLALTDFQTFIVGSLFGWFKADGMRRYRQAFVELCRGQGKSTLAAAIALLGGFFDGEAGAESYCVATKRDQAKIVFETARRMVLASPGLRKRLGVQLYNIHDTKTASKLEPLGADADTLDGLRPHIVVADEIHAHKSSAVIDVMQTGMGTRQQPLLFEITTAGIGTENVWWKHREYSDRVLRGVIQDDTWFAFIACADPDDDWTQEATWRKANPNYGISVKPDYIEAQCRKAQSMPSFQNAFRRLHCGQVMEQDERWLDMGMWDRCSADVDEEELRGRESYWGLDLATVKDISALIGLFPDDNGGFDVLCRFFIPAEGARARAERDRVPYPQWIDEGHIIATEGNVTDYDVIREHMRELAERFDVRCIAYDRWNATQLITQLQGDGAECVPIGQGMVSMSAPAKELEKLLLGGAIRHGGNPVLRWMASNVAIEQDAAGNIKPSKRKSTERIDGIVAACMALSEAMRRTGEDGREVSFTWLSGLPMGA
jgi:phage terminase large subunit-like protein